MLRRVFIDTLQKVSSQNYQDFGNFPLFTFDTYGYDLYGLGKYFSGFAIANSGSGQILVGPGRIYLDGKGYYNDDDPGTTKSLLDLAPVNLARWIAVYVVPNEDKTQVQPTTFLVNSSDRDTVSRRAAQEVTRMAVVNLFGGVISADPQKPLTGELPSGNGVIVGWVYVNNAGIGEIVTNVDAIAPSTIANTLALKENAQWRLRTDNSIAALDTNMKALQAKLTDLPDKFLVLSMAKDLAVLREKAGLPDAYSAYGSDHYLDTTKTDTANPDLSCLVQEGLRFPPEIIVDKQLGLANIYDAGVVKFGDNLLPAHAEVYRNDNFTGVEVQPFAINQFNYQDVSYALIGGVRKRLRVGPYYNVCSNWLYYMQQGASYDALNNILRLSTGETLQVFPDDAYLVNGALAGTEMHNAIRVRTVWLDEFGETSYTPQFSTNVQVSGSTIGQTFLCTQDGWLLSAQIPLPKIGPTGDVVVLCCETLDNGDPDLSRVIGRCRVPYANLKTFNANATEITFMDARFDIPISVKKGKSYAHVVTTVGNHFCYVTGSNRYAQGSLFQLTDGRWAVADPVRDLCFRNVFAQFDNTRTVVQLQPLDCPGGMLAIDLLAQLIEPHGTTLTFEGQFAGVWTDLSVYSDPELHPLIGLPLQVPLRAIFQGTADNAPMLGVGANSRARVSRPKPNLRHPSKVITPPAPVNRIQVETRYENFDPNYHTGACKLRTGAGYTTLVAPNVVQDAVDPNDPKAIVRTSFFTLAQPLASWAFDHQAVTTNVARVTHVADMRWVAFNS